MSLTEEIEVCLHHLLEEEITVPMLKISKEFNPPMQLLTEGIRIDQFHLMLLEEDTIVHLHHHLEEEIKTLLLKIIKENKTNPLMYLVGDIIVHLHHLPEEEIETRL